MKPVFLSAATLLLASVNAGWVDPDSPLQAQTTLSLVENDKRLYQLVFSDEFEQDGRSFHDGNDPRWTAMNKNDYTNNPLHYYSADSIRTSNGVLNITTSIDPKNFTVFNEKYSKYNLQYKEIKSGMLQSWNKFCYTGGIVEFSAKLPGSPSIGGLWPAIWMMGNMARATYVNSSDLIWPFSTNVCDNRTRNAQLVNSCPDSNNNAQYNMPKNRGRGAPEVDVLEMMYMDMFEHPILSSSLQVAPGVDHNRPVPGHVPNNSMNWYEGIEYGNGSSINTYFYGTTVWQKRKRSCQTDALSATTNVEDDHFYKHHTYRVEWEPPEEGGSDGYLQWFMDDKLIMALHGDSMKNVSQTEIPSEPMYLIMNTAISKDWAFPDAYFLNCKHKCWSCFDPRCADCALPKGYCSNFPASKSAHSSIHRRPYRSI
jgi:beta-glucanase (GH16 family)